MTKVYRAGKGEIKIGRQKFGAKEITWRVTSDKFLPTSISIGAKLVRDKRIWPMVKRAFGIEKTQTLSWKTGAVRSSCKVFLTSFDYATYEIEFEMTGALKRHT